MYKANTEQMLHQYTMTKDEPLFRQAKANAHLLSAVSSGNLIPVGKRIPLAHKSLRFYKISHLTEWLQTLTVPHFVQRE